MKFGTVLIVALSLATCTIAWSATNNVGQVILLDVQGLRGGTNLWISGDGNTICCFVKPPQKGESGLQEIRYSFKLSKEQDATLSDLVRKHDFFRIKTEDRYGVPDEARPAIFIKSVERTYAVAKWANDTHKHFDPLYEFLLKIAQSGREGTEIKKGVFDWSWKPEGFPENKIILSMTQPNPDKK